MNSKRGITFALLTSAREADGFRSLTFPAFRHLLDFNADSLETLAIGASEQDVPVGLVLAARNRNSKEAELVSIYVGPASRGKRVAQGLLERLETYACERGVVALRAVFVTGQPTTAALETVFTRRGFGQPELRMYVTHFSVESLSQAPWVKGRRLPAGMEIVDWATLGEPLREELCASLAAEAWAPKDLVPFDHERDCDAQTSTALLVAGQVRGWSINHRVAGKLRFTCVYVHPALQASGRLFLLYAESYRRMKMLGINECMGTVPAKHAAHAAFAQRWMKPYTTSFGESREVRKPLSKNI
ncbi:MAG: GNAT family N-acetyltransferase [Burkholderiales bacterium]